MTVSLLLPSVSHKKSHESYTDKKIVANKKTQVNLVLSVRVTSDQDIKSSIVTPSFPPLLPGEDNGIEREAEFM